MTASERILTVAVIGCGRIAGGLAQDANVTGDALSHAAAYDRHQGFRTVACVEPDEARRRGFMDRWGVEHGFATIEEATDSLGFDVASVCTPTDRHETDLWRLLDTPVRAVWCEKPLTGSFQRSARIVEAYRGADKALAVNHLRRWHPAMRDLRAEIAADKWGAVRSVVGFYTKGIRNNGSHMIDLVQFLIGPLSVRAVATARIDYDAADPTVDAILTTQAGVPVHLVGGDARDYALFEVEIVAAGGSIRIERSGRSLRYRRPIADPDHEGYRILDHGEQTEIGTGNVFMHAVDNIYRAVVEGASLESDAATALSTERLCDQLIERATQPPQP